MEFQPAYLIIGIVVLVIAIIFKLFPPKKISMWNGYRSQTAMESQEAWDSAQKYSSNVMLLEGVLLTLLGVALGIISSQAENKLNNIILISFLAIVIPVAFISLILATEVYLYKKFGKKQ